jgi:hypothetical protein
LNFAAEDALEDEVAVGVGSDVVVGEVAAVEGPLVNSSG